MAHNLFLPKKSQTQPDPSKHLYFVVQRLKEKPREVVLGFCTETLSRQLWE